MESPNTDKEPKLQKPGAGLPLMEGLVARFYYGAWVSKKGDAATRLESFDKLNKKILHIVQPLTSVQMEKKVLIPKLPGIEDSSRFWSVSETLEHIEIVGDGIAAIVENLAKGIVPSQALSIAALKPKGKYFGQDSRNYFSHFNSRTIERLSVLKITNDGPKKAHPWMGPMSALQWSWVLSSHSAIHYNQLKHILKGL